MTSWCAPRHDRVSLFGLPCIVTGFALFTLLAPQCLGSCIMGPLGETEAADEDVTRVRLARLSSSGSSSGHGSPPEGFRRHITHSFAY